MQKSKNDLLRDEYRSRINKVLDHINENLTDDFTLEDLASIANFSPYHFHRIFAGIMQETISQFITRIRLERAAARLIDNPRESITEVAFNFGFSSSSTFARAFKEKFGMSASQWRDDGYMNHSKIRKVLSKKGKIDSNEGNTISNDWKESFIPPVYISNVINDQFQYNKWRVKMKDSQTLETAVEVKDLPDMNVVYVRHIGPYQGDSGLFERLYGKLCTWAGPRGLITPPKTLFMNIYYDNPDITDDDKLRLDVALTIDRDIDVDGEIGKTTIKGGKYALARFRITPDQYENAWKMVYGGWLPESGYQPDDKPCMEIYRNDPANDPEGKHEFDICIPVKPL
jgi:AraC family transcriptional regulator